MSTQLDRHVEAQLDQDVANHLGEEEAVFLSMEKGYVAEAYNALPTLLTREQAEAAARARKGL